MARPSGSDGKESNSPPSVRLRSSLSASVDVFCTFILYSVISVRLSSQAKVSKLVSPIFASDGRPPERGTGML